jgi:hypothetical protein
MDVEMSLLVETVFEAKSHKIQVQCLVVELCIIYS